MTPSSMKLMNLIPEIRDRFSLTILLSHKHEVVIGVCERNQVVDYGKSIALGLPKRSRMIRRYRAPGDCSLSYVLVV